MCCQSTILLLLFRCHQRQNLLQIGGVFAQCLDKYERCQTKQQFATLCCVLHQNRFVILQAFAFLERVNSHNLPKSFFCCSIDAMSVQQVLLLPTDKEVYFDVAISSAGHCKCKILQFYRVFQMANLCYKFHKTVCNGFLFLERKATRGAK